MLSRRRGRRQHDEQGKNDRHVSVNAEGVAGERGVQNGWFCVNSCMDNAEAAEETVDKKKKKKKKDKVRSAWISFAGRIVAQMVGAIATVALGVMVLHRYTSIDTRPPASELSYAQPWHPNAAAALGATPAASAQPGQPPVHVIVLTPAMLGWRDAEAQGWPADRSCAPTLESAATSAAHLNNGTLLSR